MNYDRIMAYPRNRFAFDDLRRAHGLSKKDVGRLLHYVPRKHGKGMPAFYGNYKQMYGMALAWALATKDDPNAKYPASPQELREWRLRHGIGSKELTEWLDTYSQHVIHLENGHGKSKWYDYIGMAAAWIELVGELEEVA